MGLIWDKGNLRGGSFSRHSQAKITDRHFIPDFNNETDF